MRRWFCLQRRLRSLEARRTFSSSASLLTRVSVAQLLTKPGGEVNDVDVYGWVRNVRRQKKVAFVALGDGSSLDPLQAVLKPDDAAQLSVGAAVRLTGSWQASQGSKQSHELQVTGVKALGENDPEHNPLQPKSQTPEYLRTIPHLRPRIPANALLLHLRSQVIASITSHFNKQGFVQCHTPTITSSDCEGGGEVFTVSSNDSKDSVKETKPGDNAEVEHFFRTPKYLTVSSQLHLEALALAVDKVWTLSPTFRAEKSDTPRHLAEFYMLEAEMCFTDDLNDIMDVVQKMLAATAQDLLGSRTGEELLKARSSSEQTGDETLSEITTATLRQRWVGMAEGNWPRIAYAEAIDHLQKAQQNGTVKFAFDPTYENGLQAEHERYLATTIGRNTTPVFVTDYPIAQKPFYMSPSLSTINTKGTSNTAACFDLLVPDLCELVGGSMREHRLAELQATMKAKSVNGSGLEWYQDLRRYGSVPHGGFGLGFDRLLCYLSGVINVRDIVAFPRWVGRCDA
ncbi:asparaginyl-tRNA synthetase [Recurvomyces mirabilis]|uniref:asparagine--tRNA ligase n=1 Tax=Recurvomyces mirabilis TaxID=574656 RepID=A0AAE0WT17_9PEZI|nr:asparaginyl-tRNA synthetase [Recurvomyces mirabilis]KAK5159377.1 asparaginyl-tRNA synthetase [Recurvomyces mirabilis]